MGASLGRSAAAEALGTAFLLAAVVGSGIMGERLSGGNVAIALLANTLATGAALVALILSFGPISGAHFNPAVTGAELFLGRAPRADAAAYVLAQLVGAFAGVAAAHLMFELPLFSVSRHVRGGGAAAFSELVATFGLIGVIHCVSRSSPRFVAFAVGAYISAAYWFTASTSFANPAVTLARAASDTFAGIRPSDVPAFLAAQAAGAAGATVLFRWLLGPLQPAASSHPEAPMANDRTYNVLFLCTGNSARSIIAEVLLNRIGRGRFRAFSAGSHPKGEVHPLTQRALEELGESTAGLRSKAWEEFAGPGAVPLDFVFTVCSKAAGEQCPVWPGQPLTAHWGIDDPAAVEGSEAERMRAFQRAYTDLQTRIRLFTSLRIELLDRLALQRELRRIGEPKPD